MLNKMFSWLRNTDSNESVIQNFSRISQGMILRGSPWNQLKLNSLLFELFMKQGFTFFAPIIIKIEVQTQITKITMATIPIPITAEKWWLKS